ncbi:MAG TPA: hypothetical protein VMQ48_01450, partial [Candidatus Saccharimonadales bacterium]|nr:hypothetical protein [Candidatus Saccharimonadales bacterium]
EGGASVTMLETKMNQKTKSSVGAFYNSESGVEWALNKISISSGTISSTLSANPDGSVSCPISPDCKVYFLKSDGTVITQANFSTLTFDDIKAVRSVGNQGGDTQRAIEAAVAAGGSNCFTYYCNNSRNNACTDSGGAQRYCPSGFQQKYDMGTWGYCVCDGGTALSSWTFSPPGGNCPCQEPNQRPQGKGLVCCN